MSRTNLSPEEIAERDAQVAAMLEERVQQTISRVRDLVPTMTDETAFNLETKVRAEMKLISAEARREALGE